MLKHLSVFLLVALSSISHALDEDRLWLPVKYQTLYLSLVKAASVAETLQRCAVVVEGTLDLEQSQPDHPIYRIQCRQENGRTYNEMVDGVSFATLTTVEIVEPELTEEEKEALRIQEEARRMEEIARQKRDAWQQCRQQLLDRTRMMMELAWQEELDGPREPDAYSEEEIRFAVDFDARSMWDEALRYTAECSVRDGAAEVVLRKR